VRFVLWGVVFCLDFNPFLFSSLVPLLGVFPLCIYLFIYFQVQHSNVELWRSEVAKLRQES
jgi:hypothetical protein